MMTKNSEPFYKLSDIKCRQKATKLQQIYYVFDNNFGNNVPSVILT